MQNMMEFIRLLRPYGVIMQSVPIQYSFIFKNLKDQFCQKLLLMHVLKILCNQNLRNVHINGSALLANYNHSSWSYFCSCSI